MNYFNGETEEFLLLPSGDEKYVSFWVRDCAMMAESKLIPNDILKKYIKIIAEKGQNGNKTIYLENGLSIPPYAIADHINYDGKDFSSACMDYFGAVDAQTVDYAACPKYGPDLCINNDLFYI